MKRRSYIRLPSEAFALPHRQLVTRTIVKISFRNCSQITPENECIVWHYPNSIVDDIKENEYEWWRARWREKNHSTKSRLNVRVSFYRTNRNTLRCCCCVFPYDSSGGGKIVCVFVDIVGAENFMHVRETSLVIGKNEFSFFFFLRNLRKFSEIINASLLSMFWLIVACCMEKQWPGMQFNWKCFKCSLKGKRKL